MELIKFLDSDERQVPFSSLLELLKWGGVGDRTIRKYRDDVGLSVGHRYMTVAQAVEMFFLLSTRSMNIHSVRFKVIDMRLNKPNEMCDLIKQLLELPRPIRTTKTRTKFAPISTLEAEAFPLTDRITVNTDPRAYKIVMALREDPELVSINPTCGTLRTWLRKYAGVTYSKTKGQIHRADIVKVQKGLKAMKQAERDRELALTSEF